MTDYRELTLSVNQGGSNSGASQPHKHIQFIEVEDDGPPIERLARAAQLEVTGTRATHTRCSKQAYLNFRQTIFADIDAIR